MQFGHRHNSRLHLAQAQLMAQLLPVHLFQPLQQLLHSVLGIRCQQLIHQQ
jgi:hypothetical protein